MKSSNTENPVGKQLWNNLDQKNSFVKTLFERSSIAHKVLECSRKSLVLKFIFSYLYSASKKFVVCLINIRIVYS